MRAPARIQRMKETEMGFLAEYSLLLLVVVPILVVVAMQIVLFVAGERETLMLPSLRPFGTVGFASPEEEPAPKADLPEPEREREAA